MPILNAVYEKLHDSGLEIIGVNLDDDKEDFSNCVKTQGIRWPQYFDGNGWNNEVSFPLGISSLPELWFIDKKGILRAAKHHADESALAEIFRILESEAY